MPAAHGARSASKKSAVFFCRLRKSGFTIPAVGNEQSQTADGEALVFSREIGRNCNYACENRNEPQREDSR